MADCIFCDIVAKKAPAEIVHEDDRIVAFRDINGVAPVHVLVVPRDHIRTIDEAEDEELLRELLVTARRLGQEHASDGYRVSVNTGTHAEVPHMHFHVIGGKPALGPVG